MTKGDPPLNVYYLPPSQKAIREAFAEAWACKEQFHTLRQAWNASRSKEVAELYDHPLRQRQVAPTHARDVPCPKCGVPPGVSCNIPQPFEMTPRQWERDIDGQWHRARIRAAARRVNKE